jgi:hypothetical protein
MQRTFFTHPLTPHMCAPAPAPPHPPTNTLTCHSRPLFPPERPPKVLNPPLHPSPPQAPPPLVSPNLRGPRRDELRGGGGGVIHLLQGQGIAAYCRAGVQRSTADGGAGTRVLRELRWVGGGWVGWGGGGEKKHLGAVWKLYVTYAGCVHITCQHLLFWGVPCTPEQSGPPFLPHLPSLKHATPPPPPPHPGQATTSPTPLL